MGIPLEVIWLFCQFRILCRTLHFIYFHFIWMLEVQRSLVAGSLLDAHDSQGWAKLKSGTWENSTWVSHVADRAQALEPSPAASPPARWQEAGLEVK